MSLCKVGSSRFSTNCYFNKVSLFCSASQLSRSICESKTIRAWAKSYTNYWSPWCLAKNFLLACVSVSCSVKTSLRMLKTLERVDHWVVGCSLTSSMATPSRWKVRVLTTLLLAWPLTARWASEIQSSNTQSSLTPTYFPNLFSWGTETLTAGVVLGGPGVPSVGPGSTCLPNCPTSRSSSLLVSDLPSQSSC